MLIEIAIEQMGSAKMQQNNEQHLSWFITSQTFLSALNACWQHNRPQLVS